MTNEAIIAKADADPDTLVIAIGGRVLRDRRCEICQPAIRGSIATTTWHQASSGCTLEQADHCRCATCAHIAP